jgi:hypothetical protein
LIRYETYLDAIHKGRKLMDSYAESDPEVVVKDDLPEHPDPDSLNPHENGEWYPEWNGPAPDPESDDPVQQHFAIQVGPGSDWRPDEL